MAKDIDLEFFMSKAPVVRMLYNMDFKHFEKDSGSYRLESIVLFSCALLYLLGFLLTTFFRKNVFESKPTEMEQ